MRGMPGIVPQPTVLGDDLFWSPPDAGLMRAGAEVLTRHHSPAADGAAMTSLSRIPAMGVSLLLLATAPVPAAPSLGTQTDECEQHPAIDVRGDEGFEAEGSGVTGGAGTEEDPYIIEGWCITSVPLLSPPAGVRLEGTSAHVVIRNNVIEGHTLGLELVDARNVTAQANDLVDSGRYGIRLEASDANTFGDNTITGTGQYDVFLQDSTGTAWTGNALERGMWVSAAAVEHVHHEVDATNTVNGAPLFYVLDAEDVQISGPAGQVIVADSRRVTLDDVQIDDARAAVLILLSDNATVSNATVRVRGQYGVFVDRSTDTAVHDSTITGAGWDSVHLLASSDSTVGGNVLSGSGWGVHVVDSHRNGVHDNVMSGNSEGVRLVESSDNVVRDNEIADSGRYGIYLSESSGNVVRGNTITGSQWDAVRLSRSSDNAVHGNSLSDSVWAGVRFVSLSDRNAVHDNVITGNEDGIRSSVSSLNTVHDNTIADNTRFGVWLNGTSNDNVLSDNTVTGSGWEGVFLAGDGAGNVLHDNTVTHNALHGVHLSSDGQGTVLRDNVIAHNGSDGVRMARMCMTINLPEVCNDLGLSELHGFPPPSGTVLDGNNIHDNADHGLNVMDHADTVEATDNWWGHASGPSGGAQDACTGATAQGHGSSIRADAEVCFDAWLREANPDAGVPTG